MIENTLEQDKIILRPRTVNEIAQGQYTFRIPSFQRGYRWREEEINRMLNDIYNECKDNSQTKYYLQPIIVCKTKDETGNEIHNLIDGQQRITTLYLIYKVIVNIRKNYNRNDIEPVKYKIEYESEDRQLAKQFLENITELNDNNEIEIGSTTITASNNIDFYYMAEAYKKITKWFDESEEGDATTALDFRNFLKNNVMLIWYEINNENNGGKTNEQLFCDINAGKIRLTNAELLKAVFLQNNPQEETLNKSEISKKEIALQWIEFERELHNKSFWYFLTNSHIENYPTRIDILFDMMANKNPGEYTDEYYTFYTLYDKIEKGKQTAINLWQEIVTNFLLLRDWYNNDDLYNKIGYLIASGSKTLIDIFNLYKSRYKEKDDNIIQINSKEDFNTQLDKWITESIEPPKEDESYLKWSYESDQEKIKALLLLFNVLSVGKFKNRVKFDENEREEENTPYKERFPFDKYKEKTTDIKKQKNVFWSLEHIDPQDNENCPLITEEEWKTWLREHVKLFEKLKESNNEEDKNQYEFMKSLLENKDIGVKGEVFHKYRNRILELLKNTDEDRKEYLHRLDNMALLCTHHNAALSNSLFYAKREKIISMDKKGSYIPFCTRMVFYKYYTVNPDTDYCKWQKTDRENYLKEIYRTIGCYMEVDDKAQFKGAIENIFSEGAQQ